MCISVTNGSDVNASEDETLQPPHYCAVGALVARGKWVTETFGSMRTRTAVDVACNVSGDR